MEDFNRRNIEEFRANRGRLSGPFDGAPVLLLHTTGAKSGQERLHPLMYLGERGHYFIFASKGGAPTNPDWYHNLKAHPDAKIEVGSDTLEVTAQEVEGQERDEIYQRQETLYPQFAEYQKSTQRLIPVIELVPKEKGR